MINLFTQLLLAFLLLVSGEVAAATMGNDTIPVYSNKEVSEKELSPVNSDKEALERFKDIDFLSDDRFEKIKTANPDCQIVKAHSLAGILYKGKMVIPMEYGISRDLEDRIFILSQGNSKGVFDVIKMEWIVPVCNSRSQVVENQFIILRTDSYHTLINSEGEELFKSDSTKIFYNAGKKIFFELMRGKGSARRKGLYSAEKKEVVLEVIYQDIQPITGSNNYVVAINENEFRLYDSKRGKFLRSTYDKLELTLETLEPRVIAMKDGLFGILDDRGKEVFPFIYLSIEEINNDTRSIFVTKNQNGKFELFTRYYTKYSRGLYDDISKLILSRVKVQKGNKYGIFEFGKDSVYHALKVEYDEIDNLFGIVAARKGDRWNVFCTLRTISNADLPYSKVERVSDGSIIVTKDGFLSVFRKPSCTASEPTEFTYFEDIPQAQYHDTPYNYLKARKGDSPYFLTDRNLVQESQETFTDILRTQQEYIFFTNEEGKVGVYNGLADVYVLEAIYDFMESNGTEIFLYKDGVKGRFSKGSVIFK